MILQPLQSYILCTLHDNRETALHLPDEVQIQAYGLVQRVGPECVKIKPGMRVLFNPQSSVFADTIDGQKTIVISENSVFAHWIDEKQN